MKRQQKRKKRSLLSLFTQWRLAGKEKFLSGEKNGEEGGGGEEGREEEEREGREERERRRGEREGSNINSKHMTSIIQSMNSTDRSFLDTITITLFCHKIYAI